MHSTNTATTTATTARQGKKRKKNEWTEEEDQKLKNIIYHQSQIKQTTIPSEYDWKSVSDVVQSKSSSECLDRWMQMFHVPAPHIKSKFWLPEEERIIMQVHMKHGTQWGLMAKEIAKQLGRTRRYEDIKNRWFSTARSSNRSHTVGGQPSQTAGLLFCYCYQLFSESIRNQQR